MPFSDFAGNPETIHRLREMLARNRFPHAVILSGAHGSGKYARPYHELPGTALD
jgi:DNA polymerase III gamma/tau subunit